MRNTIFYSWQSDLPQGKTTKPIRFLLKTIIAEIEKEISYTWDLDESTQGLPGSPDIPDAIFTKINNSDAYIADISIINGSSKDRKTPNPNVLIELGYAIANLGWNRIILIQNVEFGDIDKIPFDISKHRIIKYKMKDANDNSNLGNIKKPLKDGLIKIINENPERNNKDNFDENTIKKQRDTESIKLLLRFINIETMDAFIENLPDRIIDRIFYFYESFKEVFRSSSFYIYDENTYNILEEFFQLWDSSLSYGQFYDYIFRSEYHKFYIKMDVFESSEQENAHREIREIRKKLHKKFKELIRHIRENYININVYDLSREALDLYIEQSERVLDELKNNIEN